MTILYRPCCFPYSEVEIRERVVLGQPIRTIPLSHSEMEIGEGDTAGLVYTDPIPLQYTDMEIGKGIILG